MPSIEIWAQAPARPLPPSSARLRRRRSGRGGRRPARLRLERELRDRRPPPGERRLRRAAPPAGRVHRARRRFSLCGQAAAQWQVDGDHARRRRCVNPRDVAGDRRRHARQPRHGAGRLALDFTFDDAEQLRRQESKKEGSHELERVDAEAGVHRAAGRAQRCSTCCSGCRCCRSASSSSAGGSSAGAATTSTRCRTRCARRSRAGDLDGGAQGARRPARSVEAEIVGEALDWYDEGAEAVEQILAKATRAAAQEVRGGPAVPRHARQQRAVHRPVRHGARHRDRVPRARRQPDGRRDGQRHERHRRGAGRHRGRHPGRAAGGHRLQRLPEEGRRRRGAGGRARQRRARVDEGPPRSRTARPAKEARPRRDTAVEPAGRIVEMEA